MFVVHDEGGPLSSVLVGYSEESHVVIEEVETTTDQDQVIVFPVFPGLEEGTDPIWQGDPWSNLQEQRQERMSANKGKGKGARTAGTQASHPAGTQASQLDPPRDAQENQESEFLRSAQSNRAGSDQPNTERRSQQPSLYRTTDAESPNGQMTDDTLRNILLGHSVVADLRHQSRQHAQIGRAHV